MKLTPMQRRVLERMAAGERLTWRSRQGGAWYFRFEKVNRRTCGALLSRGLIFLEPASFGAAENNVRLTDQGRALVESVA